MTNNNHELVQAEGTIERTGMTTYMYGDYALVAPSGNTMYALRSNVLDLKEYVSHYVKLTATRVSGYPLDGGPVYLDVQSVTATHVKNHEDQI